MTWKFWKKEKHTEGGVMISDNHNYALPYIESVESVQKAVKELQDRQVKRGVII
jgi:hypothetical protein